MKVSLSWLKEYAAIESAPEEMAAKLTMAGLEVESVVSRFDYLDRVVVARVEAVIEHPGSDHLHCCRVNVGDTLLNIVCGAPNVREGMVVPCAMVGAVLPGDFKIKKGKLRGEVSEGMLCSASELRLDSDASGLMDLDASLEPGTPLVDALALADAVFEIDLTPNRPDCLSVIGVAREAAAFQDPPVRLNVPGTILPVTDESKPASVSIDDLVRVDILDPELCPRYCAALLVDVTVGPSPFWLQQRLEAVGLTPINNVVDVTNYVMMETGQPLHAFDFDFLAQGRIEVRAAGGSSKFTTLDGKEHTLEPDMLMICDGEAPVALAGVMGGQNSEILPTTTRVLLESAYFNPVSIRKTAKRTGIATDASHRFERGVDPVATRAVLERAAVLMAAVSGGALAKGVIDVNPLKSSPVQISLNVEQLNRRLGTDLGTDQIKTLLESVEFRVEDQAEGVLSVAVPSFRVDVTRPEDLSEEVARLWGYDNIQTSFPAVAPSGRQLSPRIAFREKVRDCMVGFGFSEAVNYSFTSAESVDRLKLDENDSRRSVERLLNPISEEMAVMRSTLLPWLFENMRRNHAQQVETLRLFEVGNTFIAEGHGVQPREVECLSAILTGSRVVPSWHAKAVEVDFFDIKGVVEGLLSDLGIKGVRFSRATRQDQPYLRVGNGACIEANGRLLGVVGEVAPDVLKNFGLKQTAFVFELDLEGLLVSAPEAIVSKPLPKFPAISRDITLIIDGDLAAADIMDEAAAFVQKESLVEDAFLFDVYAGKPLAEGKRSISLRVVYRSLDKTLKEKKIKGLHERISKHLIETFKADLPS
ncbi:PheT [Desulforapulum autotrophicum HRM2]|uniref:Phenylalanine--tRNA ligase beta subunit n=1 Tax=Desulforapulum autotrophicum (strain ATCC 43914 / DSM 3382 / VKM B-1955 / HRM2) TaxID=177437 RepID=C0QHL9_DESAH|nr:phenylalanine--tRNA ligase subunit beta [Desulforapulum autotrophicum]ACN13577.1 PheT [Desulforapulum autotrophicum HRM2]